VVYHFHSSWYDEEKINRLEQGPATGQSTLAFRLKLAVQLFIIRRMEHYCYHRSKSILFLSEYSKKHYLGYGGSRKTRLRVIPGGVDINFFHPHVPNQDPAEIRSRLQLPAEGRLMLTVRRLEARMGLENLIIAASEVMHRRPDDNFHLLIAGKGSLEEKLRDLIRQQDVENRVHLLGLVPREHLPFYYRSVDLFLLPTLAIKGFGLAMVEALASGVPAMGTRVGGTVEILKHIDDKLLFPGTDSKSLATGLERFLNDPESFHALGNRCRLEAEEKYSWEKVVDRIEEEFILVQRK
jgi:glycosyltransferase involved in cell wall biosynthesis